MKCQKCARPAMVHLTEVVRDGAGLKRAVEIHLCLAHATEAGLVGEVMPGVPQMAPANPFKASDVGAGADTGLPTAIIPAPAAGGGLTVARSKEPSGDTATCPVCGLTWSQFKTTGLMGCSHDYELFEGKLSPLLKRAQEGASDHVGKVPAKKKSLETDRQVRLLRLRRELQRALDAENYEQAARVRDQLKVLEN